MDQNTLQSSFKVHQKWVNSIAKPYSTRAITLSETESIVEQTLTNNVVDDWNGDAFSVQVGESVQGFLSQAFLLEDKSDHSRHKKSNAASKSLSASPHPNFF